jgi:hypothetical protein
MMMNGSGPCCASCADGKGCEGDRSAVPIGDFGDMDRSVGSFNQPTAGSASGSPITLLDAQIDCRTKEYDPKVEKSFKLV